MPSSIKKVILQKQIESTLYQIFPKTDATIVSYTKTVTVNDTPTSVDTTVAAELAALKSAIDTNDAAALAAIDQLRDDVFGVLGDGEVIASTFDTIKEIADFLDTHDESIGALANLISDVGIASVPESSVGAGDGTAATGLLVMALLLQVFMQMLKIFRLELLHFRQLMELTFLRLRVVLQMQVMVRFILMVF